MNLQQIITEAKGELNLTVKIDQAVVWDFKAVSPTQISLISENTWEGAEDETITLSELIEYSKSLDMDFDLIEFIKEETKEPLRKVICKQSTIYLH